MDDPPGNTLSLMLLLSSWLVDAANASSIILLLAFAAWIAASESAFFALTTSELEKCRNAEDPRQKRLGDLMQKPRMLLATLRILWSLIIVSLSVFLISISPLGEGYAGIISILWIGSIVAALVIITDVLPKLFGAAAALRVAMFSGRPCLFFIAIFKPFTSLWLRLNGLMENNRVVGSTQNPAAELNQVLEMAAADHSGNGDEKEILRGIVNFGTLSVKQIMRPRSRMSAVDSTMNFQQLIDHVNKSGYSRFPVFRKNLDKVEGILHTKDLLPFTEMDQSFQWQSLVRPSLFIPGAKRLDSLLKDFQEKHIHMAIVVNEYGGTLGLVTLEDIIEEIMGDINDEFDADDLQVEKIDATSYRLPGKTSIHDLCKLLNLNPTTFDGVRKESKSVAGLLIELSRELPKKGAQITHEQFTFVVESADRKKIRQVKVIIHEREKI